MSLVDEVSDILEISNDSAYRRIRGEKPLSLHEVQKLSQHYNFSVDDLTGTKIDTVTFKTNFLAEGNYSFADWLNNLLLFTLDAGKTEEAELVFILNELNIFHIIQIPELCAFKLFFWQKSNLDFPKLRDQQFSLSEQDENMVSILEEIVKNYVRIKTKEFTTTECLNSYLKQVLFYSEAGYFSTRNDALILCEKLHQLVDHQQKQAELGYKFPAGKPQVGNEGNFQLFHNDIILADNTILIKSGERRTSFLTSNAINLMYTHNRAFFEYNYRWGRNLLSKSIPISGTAEKERNRFFRQLHEQINKLAEQI
ncbi:MAG: hypothetical protein GY790_09635 [Bacteroidetes bacterium]|nr:hypothetical protein [Bacteroidota bacterium]